MRRPRARCSKSWHFGASGANATANRFLVRTAQNVGDIQRGVPRCLCLSIQQATLRHRVRRPRAGEERWPRVAELANLSPKASFNCLGTTSPSSSTSQTNLSCVARSRFHASFSSSACTRSERSRSNSCGLEREIGEQFFGGISGGERVVDDFHFAAPCDVGFRRFPFRFTMQIWCDWRTPRQQATNACHRPRVEKNVRRRPDFRRRAECITAGFGVELTERMGAGVAVELAGANPASASGRRPVRHRL